MKFFVFLSLAIKQKCYNILIFKYLYVILRRGCVNIVTRIQ